jgi:hypothetical protein
MSPALSFIRLLYQSFSGFIMGKIRKLESVN